MSLIEETYRKIDSEGVVNMAFESGTIDEMKSVKNGNVSSDKKGGSPLDA